MAREWAELHWEKIKYFLLKTSRCEEAKGEKKKQKQKKTMHHGCDFSTQSFQVFKKLFLIEDPTSFSTSFR